MLHLDCSVFLALFLLSWLPTTLSIATPPSELFSTTLPQKVANTASNISQQGQYPQYTDSSIGQWQYFPTDTWTTGFFPAMLYALNSRASLCPTDELKATDWLGEARRWAAPEVSLETTNTVGHDVGFVSFPFQEELKLDASNQTAIDAINAFANDLAARYNPTVGCTRSWDTTDPTDFTVIIDNMMNLDVLFISANLTGNDTLRQIGISHADKTMQNHVRADGSSFHVVEYNETTGAVIRQRTAQGFSDSSTWSRGQTWGIYGFALMYQNTKEQRYLDTSRRMGTYFTSNIPNNGIVPWDFNAPDDGNRPADSSAAMIATSAFMLLSQIEQAQTPANTSGSEFWLNAAVQLLTNTTASFWKPDWQSLLSNGTVNNVANPPLNNSGIVYGDYYFVKAGNELLSMNLVNCSGSVISSSNSTGGGSSSPGGSNPSSNSSQGFAYFWTLLSVACGFSVALILL